MTADRGRNPWGKRLVAVALPFVALILLELLLRVGAAEHDRLPPTFEVAFEQGTTFFPAWDTAFSSPKPASTFRVFVLGGSSSQGFGVDLPFSVLLERKLAARHPGRRFEVVNGGLPAAGSHRVLEALKRAVRFEADLIVVYAGHNEFLEEIYFDPDGLAARHARLARLARRSHLVRWLIQRIDPGLSRFKPRLQTHFFGNDNFPLIRSEEQYRTRLRFLDANLTRMVEACRAAGAELLLVPAIPNVLWPPGSSVHSDAYLAQAEEWERLYARAGTLLVDGDREAALEILIEVNRIDDAHAYARYLLGRTRLELGRKDEAREDLVAAVTLDRHGDRANGEIIERILLAARDAGTLRLDLRPLFYQRLADDLPASAAEPTRMFLDHCHPSRRGHELIADEIARLISSEILG